MFPPETRILVVDDMATMRKLVRKHLTEMGFVNIAEASDGDDAWTKIEDTLANNLPFQIIISDWNMPKTKGIQLLGRVRTSAKLKSTLFIMLTAENERPNIEEAIQAGVNSYIIKPFTQAVLREKLEALAKNVKPAFKTAAAG